MDKDRFIRKLDEINKFSNEIHCYEKGQGCYCGKCGNNLERIRDLSKLCPHEKAYTLAEIKAAVAEKDPLNVEVSKTNRGFLMWEPIINDRCETVEFQESSAVGLNTWIRCRGVKTDHLNDAGLIGAKMGKTKEALEEAKKQNIPYNGTFIHLGFRDLVNLRDRINEVIKYQREERSAWYDDTR